jgi:hypothetical protein
MKICFKNAKKSFKDTEFGVIKEFIKFLQSEVPLKKPINIEFLSKRNGEMTTGKRSRNKILILTNGRLLIDIMRTISHEWVHEFQYQQLGLDEKAKIQDIGGPVENMANILSGIFMKKFQNKKPKFKKIMYGENK